MAEWTASYVLNGLLCFSIAEEPSFQIDVILVEGVLGKEEKRNNVLYKKNKPLDNGSSSLRRERGELQLLWAAVNKNLINYQSVVKIVGLAVKSHGFQIRTDPAVSVTVNAQ